MVTKDIIVLPQAYQCHALRCLALPLRAERCRRPAQAVKRKRVDLLPAAVSYSPAAVAHGCGSGFQTSLYKQITDPELLPTRADRGRIP